MLVFIFLFISVNVCSETVVLISRLSERLGLLETIIYIQPHVAPYLDSRVGIVVDLSDPFCISQFLIQPVRICINLSHFFVFVCYRFRNFSLTSIRMNVFAQYLTNMISQALHRHLYESAEILLTMRRVGVG
jgi:hypothetical protein